MLSTLDKIEKRLFDIIFSIVGIGVSWWIMILAWIVATVETKSNGLFVQERIGRDAKKFHVFKIKTMKKVDNIQTHVTTKNDSRITKSGAFFRSTKIDELPQLFNVLFGTMSFVGPRPDVAGFADVLEGDDRIILSVRPGITGPASLKYKEEEIILAQQDNPEAFNRDVIWKDKVRINKNYVKHWSLKKDIMYIIKTITG
ncbi:MAG TPA: sugar transferase [Epsilonproteobacteria bacterium]|nr:sugar transferase [Campylobacterota bacterium]